MAVDTGGGEQQDLLSMVEGEMERAKVELLERAKECATYQEALRKQKAKSARGTGVAEVGGPLRGCVASFQNIRDIPQASRKEERGMFCIV